MASYKTEAIIINRLNLGESDRILTLFSPIYGKIRAICKGSRKTKSKFGGHTELFSLVDLIITKGKNLDIITEATLIQSYLSDNPDMEKIRTIYYFAEVINKLLPDENPNKDVYELFLYCLQNIHVFDTELLQLLFLAKLLKNFGIYPELMNCVKCEQKPDKDQVYFSKSAGGIMDKNCSLHFEDAVKTDEGTVKLWRFVADAPLTSMQKLTVGKEAISSAASLAIDYIQCVTMIDAKSLRVLS